MVMEPEEDAVRCPACGVPTTVVLGDTQALCTNDAADNFCHVIFFDPSLPDGGMSDPQFITLTDDGRVLPAPSALDIPGPRGGDLGDGTPA